MPEKLITKTPIKGGVSNSLLDERVQVIISTDPAIANESQIKFARELRDEGRNASWSYWGDYGKVRAVYTKSGDLMLTLQRENTGELFEVYASHVKVVPAKN